MRPCYPGLILAASVCVMSQSAGAVTMTGGVVSANAGLGACHDNQIVPLATPQNSFTLSAIATCAGYSASGTVRGDAATVSVGAYGISTGGTFGYSQMSSQVSLIDQWILTPSSALVTPATLTLPVSINLDGVISSDAVFSSGFGRFIDYNLSIADNYAPLGPSASFSQFGSITSTGAFGLHANGNIVVYVRGGSVPTAVSVALSLFIPALNNGTVDFLNTGSIVATLPAGWTATTASGVPLAFQTTAVPLPQSFGLMLTWIIGAAARVTWKGRHRRQLSAGH